MTKSILKYLIYFGLLLNILACSSFQYVESNPPDDIKQNQNSITSESILYSCELLSMKVNAYEEIIFPLISNGMPQKIISPTLNISSTGNFKGFSACNSFYGNYSREGNTIKFTDIISSLRSCNNEFGLTKARRGNEVERIIVQTLSIINTITIENEMLFLKKDSDILMTYKIK